MQIPSLPSEFVDLADVARSYNERNDCGVKALAVMLGGDYGRAHAALRSGGRVNGKGSPFGAMLRAIAAEGLVATVFHSPNTLRLCDTYNRRGAYIPQDAVHGGIYSKTVRTVEFELRDKFPGRRFLVFTSRHVLAFDGQKVIDWTVGRKHRVRFIWEITDAAPVPTIVEPTPEPKPEPKPEPQPEPTKKIVRKPRVPVVVDGRTFESFSAAYKFFGFSGNFAHLRKRFKANGFIVIEGVLFEKVA